MHLCHSRGCVLCLTLILKYGIIKYFDCLHGNIEKDGEEELIVNCHGDEAAFIELGGSLPDHDTQSDAPQQYHQLHCKQNVLRTFY